jgi:HlyD family secretion protein
MKVNSNSSTTHSRQGEPAAVNQHNGSSQKLALTSETAPGPPKPAQTYFDQPVILQQSPVWSRAIVWTIVGVTTAVIVWASIFKIEEAIPAQGKLEPQGAVKEVQAPVGGVVEAIHVKDGQRVKKGELLLSLDPTASQAQLGASNKVRAALVQENQFYRSQLSGQTSPGSAAQQIAQLKLPSELVALTRSRAALMSENQLYRAELGGVPQGANLSLEERARLQSSQVETSSRTAAARLEVGQLTRQLGQNQVQLASARDIAGVNQGILRDIQPLVEEGAIARIQYLKQQQEVSTRQAEVDQLVQEQERLKLAIAQAQQRLQNTVAVSQEDLLTKIADNEKQIAGIDTQFSKAIVENEKQIAEIDNQLSQTKLAMRYQELRAPVDGTVFDLKPKAPGFVTNASEPVLKIVPGDRLIAKIFITNKDVGFVRKDMPVDVRIDSFPFSEFGDIKGRIESIGSDALPPDQIRPFYSFPATIHLEQQSMMIKGREVSLQSGESISANIKVRNRTVMSIFTDLFTKQVESLKTVR